MLLGGCTIRDVHNKGLIDVTRVITKSSNVGAAEDRLDAAAANTCTTCSTASASAKSTGCGFPGESPGFLPIAKSLGTGREGDDLVWLRPQRDADAMAQAYAALANDGRLRAPTFVKGALNPDSAVIDPQIAANDARACWKPWSSPGRHGDSQAAVPNYRVAGKTGTSRRAIAGGYEKRYVSLFAGMVPASDPRLVGVVVINDPGGARRRLLRRPRVGAGIQQGHGRRAAPARCAAGQRAALVRRIARRRPSDRPGQRPPDYPADQPNYEEAVPR